MPDCKTDIINAVKEKLALRFSPENVHIIEEIFIKELKPYDVTKTCTELVEYDDQNNRILKRYCACLLLDGKSEKTIYQYRRTCVKFADVIWKHYTDVNVYDVRYYLAKEKERGISNRSIENTRANLSAFFQWMAREEMIPRNPCQNIAPIKYDAVIRKPFSDVEIDALRSACKAKRERAIIEILLSSGIRVSELCQMEIGDIDKTHLKVHVRNGKGGKERITYITDVAMRHLSAYLDERKGNSTAVILNSSGKPINASGIRYVLHRIGNDAEIKNVHPHRFRRTFASGLAARGMNVQDIQKLMGHSNINTTMEYIYINDMQVSESYKRHIA